jgi:RNA polymerase sigma-70 factor, ECF subfamily
MPTATGVRTGRTPVAGTRADRPSRDVAFTGFYAREFRDVVGLIFTLTGSWAVAEDIAQEAFVRAYRAWDEVARHERPAAWIRTVAVNLATSRGRRLAVEARVLARVWARSRRFEPGPEQDALAGDAAEFWKAVRSLPPRQAQAIALRYHGELSVSEMAAAMDCAEGTVKAHLHAARTTLSTKLDTREDPAS